MSKKYLTIPVVLWVASLAGCREERPIIFEPNLVHTYKYSLKEGYSMDQAAKDTTWAVTELFGTPDQPKLPEVMTKEDADESLKTLVSMERLEAASGPADAEGRGLYRKHCADCHGVSGNGRGPTAAIINPYPRDYRLGIFKFKTTERGSKPTREDVARSIRHGIAGTAMRPIEGLSEEGVQALTDYVIYLSIRGEVERTTIDTGVMDLNLEEERIINPAQKNSTVEDDKTKFAEDWGYIEETVASVAGSWAEAADAVVEVPEVPAEIPMANNHAEFVKLMASDDAQTLNKSIERGRELFKGKVAACSKCHGEEGKGDGQTTDFDDWTKDWTTRVNLDPTKRDELIPLLARGALPPLNIKPRNFAEGYFRGGDSAADLWIRITQGIEGTPMPAATFVEGAFEEDDVWHLINFIRSLQKEEPQQPTPPVSNVPAPPVPSEPAPTA